MNFLQLLLPDFSLIACGYLLCRFTPLNRSVWEQVEALVYYFLFPVLLFHSIVRSPLDLGATSSLIAAGIAMGLCGIAMAYALPRLPWIGRRFDRRTHASAAQIAFRFNSFVGLALAERLAGPQGLLLIAVLIGFCVPMFNIAAVWPMARHGEARLWNALVRNPLIIATVCGLAANLVGLRVPGWAEPTLGRIGAASIALGLMSAGAGMRIGSLAQARTLSVAVLAIRHLLTPLVGWLLARAMGLSPAQTVILLAFSALPTAPTAYVLAARMGYDAAYVAGLVTVSTLMGALSLWFALGLLAPAL